MFSSTDVRNSCLGNHLSFAAVPDFILDDKEILMIKESCD